MEEKKTKRIVKNTLLMYCRMFITMGISLYTSRVILHALGETDLGIYNLVGGFVVLFTFINSAMLTATQRFINFELGRDNIPGVNLVFKSAYLIHLIIAVSVVVLGVALGRYFIEYQLQIPPERIQASYYVLYLSCITCALQILTLPYQADIVAHEHINVYAWFSITESVMRLAIAFMIDYSHWDRLVFYAVLITVSQMVMTGLNVGYCHARFREVKGRLRICASKLKEMGKFAVWCLIGCMAASMAGQGINILLGMFFPPFVNTARAIAVQVQTAAVTFGSNLNTALTPQLTQSYASGNRDFFFEIIYRGSKYVFFLMLLVVIPLLLKTEYIARVWLGEVPEYVVPFIQWILLATLIETSSVPLMRASDASGKIRVYHFVVGGILLLILPLSYVALKLDTNPVIVYQVYLGVNIVAWGARLVILRRTIGLSVRRYCRHVLLRMVVVLALAYMVCCLLVRGIPDTLWGLAVVVIICSSVILCFSYYLGMDAKERAFIAEKARARLARK